MYYARLTQVKPADVSKMDPSLGRIICETASTGKFIINEVNWKSAIAPNADSFTAYLVEGDIKIVEPLGSRFIDYLRFAAIDMGIINHLDARYLLEIEFISSETLDEPAIKYIWPIMFVSTDGRINEKGSEYTIKFVHCAHHAMNSQVQPIKVTATVNDVKNVGEYFRGLATVLERQEFAYAKAGEKAGKPDWPNIEHPATTDDFHDEYYFIVDPRIQEWTLTTKGEADAIKKGAWYKFSWDKFNVEARAGTTLNAQITKVLSSTNNADELYTQNYDGTGKGQPAKSGSTSKDRLKEIMGKIYNFVRVETYTVYKSYDYVRGRYACKHLFFIWLALEPKLYQYPDELDVLHAPENRKLVLNKLKAYIQEGLLAKWYYFAYTGLNTEILKLDIQLNQAYYLPSFPVIWADREKTGFGTMNPWVNSNRELTPYAVSDNMIVLNARIQQLEQELRQLRSQPQDSGTQLRIQAKEKALLEARATKDAKTGANPDAAAAAAGATSRAQLLAALSGLYIEDIDYTKGLKASLDLADNYPSLRPIMAPDGVISLQDNPRVEAERLMDKIFNVALQAKDLLNLDMEVRGDPYWFGPPNIGYAPEKLLNDIEMPPAFKDLAVSNIKKLDPNFNYRKYEWGLGIDQHGNYYKGGNLVYLHVQLPNTDSTETNQNMTFDVNDAVIGIYQILFVENIFKDGRFTQNIRGVRDLTIPSQFIPRSNINEVTAEGSPTDTTWETFVKSSLQSDRRAIDDMKENRIRANTDRMDKANGLGVDSLTGEQGMGARGKAPSKMATGLDEDIMTAKTRYDVARSKAELPPVRNPVEYADSLVSQGYTKDAAYKMAQEQWDSDKKNYFQALNTVTNNTYQGTSENPITKYRPYSTDAMVAQAGDGGLEDWRRGNTQRPGPWALNNPAGLGYDARTGTYNQYPSLEDGLRAQHEYYNYGVGVPVGSTSAGGTKLPDRYLLPTEQTTYDYNSLTGQYKATGSQPVTYTPQQELNYIKQQSNTRLAGQGPR